MAQAAQPYGVVLDSPVGRLGIRLAHGRVCAIDFLGPEEVPPPADDPLGREVAQQLARYFDEPCAALSIPLEISGTAFQRRVWEALRAIPPGETRRYGQLAEQLKTSPRAIGNACRANPVPIVIPCHRVVGATGLRGYAGATAGDAIATKGWLLRHEAHCVST
jgi:methylated-DNA-[protein]-cysteine S-methyltransferase